MRLHWNLRAKVTVAASILLLSLVMLGAGGWQGVYSFRDLARGVKTRAYELPLAQELSLRVSDLRATFSRLPSHPAPHADPLGEFDGRLARDEFHSRLDKVNQALEQYAAQLATTSPSLEYMGDVRRERETVREIRQALAAIDALNTSESWVFDGLKTFQLEEELDKLQQLSGELPSFLQQRMLRLADDVDGWYHGYIFALRAGAAGAALALIVLALTFWLWIFRPLRALIHGSRRVAGGDFDHRIEINSGDEVAELGRALNAMTDRFQEIRNDLDAKVRQRSAEVIRSERLASVGFLAAGVAHEINNPLASIALAAESLSERLDEVFQQDDVKSDAEHNPEISVTRKYLKHIEDEAFRCKGITERLLDFSRMGDLEKHDTDLVELVRGVIEMVGHIGNYKRKRIEFRGARPVTVSVQPQELKQVVLNLITNGLDSLDPDGCVRVEVRAADPWVEIVVKDNGCGLADEVKQHLFEPFFTRRRGGGGTGLGLSITYRIVQDHGGEIQAHSEGPGTGSTFVVRLPLVNHEKAQARKQAA